LFKGTIDWVLGGLAFVALKPSEKAIAKVVSATKYTLHVLLYFLAKATIQSEISILVYHSVSTCSRYSVSPAEFRRQMDYLVKNYHVVSLSEILDFLEGKRRLPRKSVAITFDDGYFDNYVVAYPYLKKYHLPATIFIATAYVQKKMHLGNLLLPMLSWNQIVEMINNNIDIGAHTVSHLDLSRIDIQSAKKEILESKIEIEKETGKKVDYLAYPYGRYKNDIINLVRRLGFRCAFGGEGVIKKNPDMFVLPRIEVKRSIGYAMFKMRLTVASDWYKKLEQTFKRAFEDFPFMSWILKAYDSLDSKY
jgi:peptidoglycan/xylan/chitin deacetylase (PgdA/CDA1 family)